MTATASERYDWQRHRFKDLISLGERARDGHCAFEAVTKQQGERLLTLLAEAVQYQDAHAHSQQLRAAAEAQLRHVQVTIERLTDLLNRALDEGRNIIPTATDDEAHAIEALAVKCLAILDE